MYARLLFRVAAAGDMFQYNIDVICKELLNVIDIANDIFIVVYDADSRDHQTTLMQVM